MTPADLTKHRRRCDPASVPMLCDEIERLEKRIAGDALEIKIRGEILDLINTILGTPMGLWHDMPGTLERKRDAAASNVSRWMEAAEIEHGRVLELQEQNARLRAALERIANPLDFIRAEAKREEKQIDGVWTAMLLKDANYYRGIAEKALAPHAAGARGE